MTTSNLDYHGIFDASPNPYLVLDRDLHIVVANRAYLRLTQRDLADIVGRSAWDAFPTDPETLRQSIASFERVIHSRQPDTIALLRFDIPRPEAEDHEFETRYWSLTHTPVMNTNGEVEQIIQHALDVTELERLRQAEHALPERRQPNLLVSQTGLLDRAQTADNTNLTLMEAVERLESMFQQAPGFMALLHGPEHVYELANDAYLQLIGHRDILGKPVREALPELGSQGFFQLLDEAYATGKPFAGRQMSAKFQRIPGGLLEECFVDFIFQPIFAADGKVEGIFIQGNDVTEQKRIEDARHEAAELAEHARDRLNALLDAAPVGIVMADPNGKLLEMNTANVRIWGELMPATENVEQYREWKGWWADGSARHGQLIQPGEWAMARALRGEEGIQDIIEIEPFNHPGMRKTVINSGAAIRDAKGKITGAVIAEVDITSQVRAEEALRESEGRLRALISATADVVYRMSPDWKQMRQLEGRGFMQDTPDPRHFWLDDYIAPEDQELVHKTIEQAIRSKSTFDLEHRVRRIDGSFGWTLSRAVPMLDMHGEIYEWIGAASDITERKLGEEKLRDADRRKDEFLAMLAHELRNPLAPITSAAQLLQMAKLDEARVQRTSEIIVRQVKHMTSLVDDLLDVSRVTRGMVELEKAPLDIRRIVVDAVEQVSPLIQARRHHLMLHVPPEMAVVSGDKKRLVQVIANLLTNAAKYTPEGGNIVLQSDVLPDQVILSVQDDGIGMAPVLVERVFELFVQAERTSDRSGGGLGLGLALVKSLVELHGGKVACTSRGAGKGSRFTVCLPRLVDQDQKVERRQAPRSSFNVSRPLKIMVVDDNADAAQMLAMFLEAAGHQVIVEFHARQALERARNELPDVYLLDIGLPEMDGNELAKQLRARPDTNGAILIAVTGYGQEHDRQKSIAAGFDHHMTKPVDIAKLSTILAAFGHSESVHRM